MERELAVCQSVFVGRVLARSRDRIEIIGNQEPAYQFVFEVQRIYKGPTTHRISVKTGLGGGDCGYPFEIGKSYLVYAGGDVRLETNICTRTTPLALAAADLSRLGAPQTVFVPVPMLSFAAATGIVVCVLVIGIAIGMRWGKKATT